MRLLGAAICLHMLLTACVFFSGRLGLLPSFFEVNGIAVASDGFVYHPEAIALVEMLGSEGFNAWLDAPSPFHLKLYSLSYALLHRLSGFNILSAEPLNLFYYLAIIWLVFRLGREAFDRRVGFLAAVAVALWPSFLLHTTQLLKDPLFIASMLSLMLVLAGWLRREHSWRKGLLLGAAGGGASALLWLVRSEMWEVVLAIISLGVGLLVVRQLLERRMLRGNAAGACVLVVLALSVPRVMKTYEPFGAYRATDTGGVTQVEETKNVNERDAASGLEQIRASEASAAGGQTLWLRLWRKPQALAARIGGIRRKFIVEYPSATSNIDTEVRFQDLGGFLRYVPRAVVIGFFAPFPDMWFVKKAQVGLAGRMFSGLETIAIYACEALAVFGLWRRRRHLPAWLLVLAAAVGVASLGIVVVNIGTLYRLRYVFWMLVVILGVDGAMQLRRRGSATNAADDLPRGAREL